MASEKIIAEKEKQVKELAEEMKDAALVLLVDYRGITVEIDTQLRRDVRKTNASYHVIKNNITRRALAENKIEGIADELIEGPTAVIIAKDEYLPALKAVYKFAKANDYYKIKVGVIDGKVNSEEELITLAKLPSKEELIAKLAGCLLANVSKLAATLDAVRVKKESESAE